MSATRLTLYAAIASVYVALLGPLNIYLYNSEEFVSSPAELVGMLLLVVGILFLLLLCLLLLLPHKLKDMLFRIIAIAFLGAWALSTFLYGEYGRLDGAPLTIERWGLLALAQSVIFLALTLLAVNMRPGVLFRLVGLVFLISLMTTAIDFFTLESKEKKNATTELPASLTQFSPEKNVLHVVLDELGSDLFFAALESDRELKRAFDGFTYFDNTLSVYPSTEMSIAALMTGAVYRNEEPKTEFLERLRQKKSGVRRLEAIGYEMDSHTTCRLGVLSRCSPTNSRILKQKIADIEALKLLDIFIFKSVPDFFKPNIYNHERWFFLGMHARNSYLKSHAGIAHLLFEKYLGQLTVSPDSSPRYQFFHSMVTHTPADLDASCKILEHSEQDRLTSIDFVKCGLGHFVSLLETLKWLGIYDQTMIVLSSDHGDHWQGHQFDIEAFEDRGITKRMLTRSSATLAIKPFDSRGPMAVSEAPVSLRDIPATILAAHGLEPESEATDGVRDVFSVGEEASREREFLHYKWEHKYWSASRLPPIITLKVNGDLKNPESWQILSERDGAAVN